MARVWFYMRVSTLEQLNGLQAQRETLLREWQYKFEGKRDATGSLYELGDRQGPPGTGDNYREPWEIFDRGISGSTPLRQRPEGTRLSTLIQKGDVVVGAKLDRVFRNTQDAAECLEWFARQGVWLVLCDLGLDTRTVVGRMMVAILAAVAQFERERRRERHLEANAVRRARGEALNQHAHYGFKFRKHSCGKVVRRREIPDPYTRKCGQLFLKQKLAGMPDEKIYIWALVERIRQRSGKEWSRTAIQYAMAGEVKLRAWEQANRPIIPQEAIDAVKVGKHNL